MIGYLEGTLTVGKAMLTVTANNATRAYGTTNPPFTATYSGFTNGDDTSVFSGAPVHAKSPQHVGTTNGMVMQASHLSQFVIPIVVAWVATRTGGWGASLGVMLLLSLVGIVAAFAIAPYERNLRR